MGEDGEYWSGMLHKIFGNGFQISSTYDSESSSIDNSLPTVNSIWCRFGIIFTSNVDEYKSHIGEFPEIHSYEFNKVPRPFAEEGVMNIHDISYENGQPLPVSTDWGFIQSKVNEMWGKDENNNWITKYCKGINLIYLPGFAEEGDNGGLDLKIASTICDKNNQNIVDAVFVHNYTFTFGRWKLLRSMQNNEDETEITYEEKYFSLPPKLNTSPEKFDYPLSACCMSHEIGHYLLGKKHVDSEKNLMRGMDPEQLKLLFSMVLQKKSDLLILTKDQIKKARRESKCIKNLIR